MSGNAKVVYDFINACLALIKNPNVDTKSLSTPPSDADIIAATTAAGGSGGGAGDGAKKAAESASSLKNMKNATHENVKATLKLILEQLGYTDKSGIFVKGKDDQFNALNIATSNYWIINKGPDNNPVYGGKKRKTNRRKHRRSNRKTLGRKK
jgi:hypothetical protein